MSCGREEVVAWSQIGFRSSGGRDSSELVANCSGVISRLSSIEVDNVVDSMRSALKDVEDVRSMYVRPEVIRTLRRGRQVAKFLDFAGPQSRQCSAV